jgi:hypothetical protein
MPAAHTSQTPSSGDIDNGAAITTGVRFTVSEELECSGIAFWVPTTNSGTYTVGLYETTADDVPDNSGTGDELATATATSGEVTPDDWAEVLFDTPVTLSPGVVYTAARHATSGRYVATSNAFNGASISGNGVALLQSGTNPNPPDLGAMRNGVFVEGADLAYPVSYFGLADYFVDVVIGAEPEPEEGTMAASQQVTVTDSATLLDINTTASGRSLLVRNRGSIAVYVGGPAVTTSTGFQLDPGEAVSLDADDGSGAGSGNYGITASSTARVDVLQVG